MKLSETKPGTKGLWTWQVAGGATWHTIHITTDEVDVLGCVVHTEYGPSVLCKVLDTGLSRDVYVEHLHRTQKEARAAACKAIRKQLEQLEAGM